MRKHEAGNALAGLEVPQPHHPRMERDVVGAMLRDRDARESIINVIGDHADAFFIGKNRLLYQAVKAQVDRGADIDIMTTVAELERKGDLEAAGGCEYISEAVQFVTARTHNAEPWALELMDLYRRRAFIRACQEAIQSAGEHRSDDCLRVHRERIDALGGHSSRKALCSRKASEIEIKEVSWLWPGRIPLGMLTVVSGNPGLGKSLVTLHAAAAVTTGATLPDGAQGAQGAVAMLSAEDVAECSIVPRFLAAGGHPDRLFVLDAVKDSGKTRCFDLSRDMDALESLLGNQSDIRAVVIDPLNAYLGGGIDSHRDSDIRGVLSPLASMAERYNVAVIVVSHLNKSQNREAIHRIIGSVGVIAAARAGYVVTKDPEDDERRLFLLAKSNIAKDPGGLAYRIVGAEAHTNGRTVETCRIEWLEGIETRSADDVFAALGGGNDSEDATARDEAKEFLLEELKHGSVPAKEIYRQASDAGFSKRTIDRAKSELRITPRKIGMKGGWVWELPEDCQKITEAPQEKTLATFEGE